MSSRADTHAMSIFLARKTARNSLLVRRDKPLEALSSDEYLERTGVKLFAEDAIKQFVLDRSDSVNRYFERYFASVVMQSHVEGRKFEFVNANVRNRVAFIAYLEQNLAGVDDNTELTVEDMHQILALRCPGFPRHIMSQATAHIDVTRGPKINFRRLFTCFKACFVYNEFLRFTHDIYGHVLQGDTKKALDSVLTEIQTSDRRRSSVIAAKFGEKIVLQLQAAHASSSEQYVLPTVKVPSKVLYQSDSSCRPCPCWKYVCTRRCRSNNSAAHSWSTTSWKQESMTCKSHTRR
ncbi:hypothetical protein, variant [Aphanomyces invadans]|uniref:Centriolar satellite-associated tubulin polyglutamylase complex regulator 1 n=1 Tax=Aphanomyces invadans TaxID=157072 RepID=A0A024UQ36_9STRA|nr:hypothetical protein, variant [Aphanomyces invadans]ETW07922.1 hypothetical protein, variant [Aphanomyces invadans]|eukprot:XP_008864015.1 hypothetical protein, variant [Aphanomyces invadans]